jgi:hypothetical protein
MRRDKERTNADGASAPRSRGLGPFSGGQLTVVIVAIAAMFAIPTAALAASGAFTNNSATVPAVMGTNSNAKGVGVQGTGKKYGVLSNGPLGVAAGKALKCSHCVSAGDLSTAIRKYDPISGTFLGTDGTERIGHHVVSTVRSSAGVYAVKFDTNVAGCAYNATTNGSNALVDVSAVDDHDVLVQTYNSTNMTPQNANYSLLVTC